MADEYKKISELETSQTQMSDRAFVPVVVGGETVKIPVPNLYKVGEYTITLPAANWGNSNHKITVVVPNVTSSTTQVIYPLAATSADNIANNKALQKANIQDAGQGSGTITLYAEKVPTVDLYIRVIVYV